VDDALLRRARALHGGATDAVLLDEALAALLAGQRVAGRDASYAAYDVQPAETPDAWGDLASFRAAAAAAAS
jgi:hypothetical protein